MVLAKNSHTPGKPVPYSCLCHPDDHAVSTGFQEKTTRIRDPLLPWAAQGEIQGDRVLHLRA